MYNIHHIMYMYMHVMTTVSMLLKHVFCVNLTVTQEITRSIVWHDWSDNGTLQKFIFKGLAVMSFAFPMIFEDDM